MSASADEQGRTALRVLGWVAIALALIAILVPVGAFTFSVQVQGDSMAPTLSEGDRLLLDFTDRKDIERFDLVDATFERANIRVVKRVIGLPGDRLAVARVEGDAPRVFLQPEGDEQTYLVVNEAWTGQVGGSVHACCNDDGTTSDKRRWMTVPDGQYWLVGDNWGASEDSREMGFVATSEIAGRLNFRLRPFGEFGRIPNPVELVPTAE